METVTSAWKEVQSQQLLNESYIEISFAITDPDAITDATASDNGALSIADTASIVSQDEKSIVPYATLEENLWLLDGSRRFIPASNQGDNGYIGNLLSDENCAFTTNPVIDVQFSTNHDVLIPGVTIVWGTAYDEYARAFTVSAYKGTALVAQKQITDNTSVTSIVQMDIKDYDHIRVEIVKWCLPHHRARIARLFIGIEKVYTKSDVLEYQHEQDVDPIGATAPINKMTFAIDNSDDAYDPNNTSGLSKYLIERQRIQVKYGLKMNDGSIRYIRGGVFYLSEWEAPQNGIKASFTGRDLLEFMQKPYVKGFYTASGTSLYDLADSVFNEANLPLNDDGTKKWVIDNSLKTITTVAPLPMSPLSECLQYIAQAGRCVLYSDRAGMLHMEPISATKQDYAITAFNSFQRPEISLQKPLGSVDTKVYNYFTGETGQELFSGQATVNGTQELTVTYSQSAINVSATVTGGTLVSANYYTNACVLKITAAGAVTIQITGDILKTSTSDYVLQVDDKGEAQGVNNPLIASSEMAAAVSQWVKAWLSNRRIITIGEWRADPRLDAADLIDSQNKFDTDDVRITSVKYTFAGAFRGSGEGRIV